MVFVAAQQLRFSTMDQSRATLAGQYHHKYHHKYLLFLLNAYKIGNRVKRNIWCVTLLMFYRSILNCLLRAFFRRSVGSGKEYRWQNNLKSMKVNVSGIIQKQFKRVFFCEISFCFPSWFRSRSCHNFIPYRLHEPIPLFIWKSHWWECMIYWRQKQCWLL